MVRKLTEMELDAVCGGGKHKPSSTTISVCVNQKNQIGNVKCAVLPCNGIDQQNCAVVAIGG